MAQRLIDPDALKNALHVPMLMYNGELLISYELLLDIINEQPTVDAVPVIRCYECKYFTEFEKGFSSDWDGSCRYWNTHSTVYSNFCGCGARMDEE